MTTTEHHPLPGLLDGVNATLVGGPLIILPPAAAPTIGRLGQGALTSLVKFDADIGAKHNAQKLGRVPLVMTGSVFGSGGGGPLVGVARWGSGNGYQQAMEFDIQLGFPEATLTPPPAAGSTLGGQLFSVPGTSLEIAGRNDANFIPGAGSTALGIGVGAFPPSSGTASIGTGNRAGAGGALTRTIYSYFNPAVPVVGAFNVAVPAFAKRFRVLRFGTPALTVQIADGNFVAYDGPYTEAAGAPPTTYQLPGSASVVVVTAAAPGCTVVGCIFELGL